VDKLFEVLACEIRFDKRAFSSRNRLNSSARLWSAKFSSRNLVAARSCNVHEAMPLTRTTAMTMSFDLKILTVLKLNQETCCAFSRVSDERGSVTRSSFAKPNAQNLN
jgi:hypothetical protein